MILVVYHRYIHCECMTWPTSLSLELKKAAYGCVWYNRLQFKKLLHLFIVCSLEPVTINAGKFYTVSLETFAAVQSFYLCFI
jgi:hypothetical protein